MMVDEGCLRMVAVVVVVVFSGWGWGWGWGGGGGALPSLSLLGGVELPVSSAVLLSVDSQEDRDWVGEVVDYMRGRCGSTACVAAVEVGVPARLLVFCGASGAGAGASSVMLNAVIVGESPERVPVVFVGGGGGAEGSRESRDFARWVNVSYLDGGLRRRVRVFRGEEGECVQWTFR